MIREIRISSSFSVKRQLAAFGAALGPMALLTAWMYGMRAEAPGAAEFFIGPLLIGGGMIFWLLYLHLVYCRDQLESLGFRLPGLWRDILLGMVFGLALLELKFLSDPLLHSLFSPQPPSEEVLTLIRTVANDPWLLALWLGPVVWVGVATFEELWRAVVLRRLWALFSGQIGRIAALLLVSMLIGLAHVYQGPAAIASITFKSILMGGYFMYSGRIRPLIVAHAVYDSVQIILAVQAIRAAI